MTGVDVSYWDAQATSVEAARRAVWAADGWDEGVAETLDVLAELLSPLDVHRPRLLDLGCGVGRVAIPAATRFAAAVVGVDPSGSMIAVASEQAGDASGVSWCRNDGRTVPRWLGRFDGGWSVLCFQHLPDEIVAGYLAQLPEVLRPGAPFVAQWVVGDGRGEHVHERHVGEFVAMASTAGVTTLDVTVGRMQPNWAWATMQA